MDWLYYLLEANLYLLLFYGFYRLFLQNETFYSSNRYYLLSSTITAFVLPIMQLGFLQPAPLNHDLAYPSPFLYTDEQLANLALVPIKETINYTAYLYPIYLFFAFCFAIKLGLSIAKIIRLWLKSTKHTNSKFTLVELSEEKSAFSFFNLLFIHPHLAEEQAVLKHELVHIKQRHSLDILFFELLQIICWFNPVIYFIKKDVKLLHEFIADELSTGSGMPKHQYALFLIENSFGVIPNPLTNQIFNQSILKRRINMLNKKRTADRARLRLLLVLPLIIGMLCASTMAFTKDYGYVDLLPEKVEIQASASVNDEVKMAKEGRYSPNYIYDENDNYKSLEKRLIVVNGVKIKDNNKYYGNRKADKILFLNSKSAKSKYGNGGKYGAVEVYGRKSILIFQPRYVIADTARFPAPIAPKEQVKFPPPVVKPNKAKKTTPNLNPTKKKDQVKFPPPVVKPDKKPSPPSLYPESVNQTRFSPRSELKHDGTKYQIINPDKRYIVINGIPVTDMYNFHGVLNTESVTILDPAKAIKIYGYEKGKYGAVEVKGANLTYFEMQAGPPLLYSSLELNRNKGELFKVPNTDAEQKILTIYNSKNVVVYNSTNYKDDWDGKQGNYGKFRNAKLVPSLYTYLMKIEGKPLENKRGQLFIK